MLTTLHSNFCSTANSIQIRAPPRQLPLSEHPRVPRIALLLPLRAAFEHTHTERPLPPGTTHPMSITCTHTAPSSLCAHARRLKHRLGPRRKLLVRVAASHLRFAALRMPPCLPLQPAPHPSMPRPPRLKRQIRPPPHARTFSPPLPMSCRPPQIFPSRLASPDSALANPRTRFKCRFGAPPQAPCALLAAAPVPSAFTPTALLVSASPPSISASPPRISAHPSHCTLAPAARSHARHAWLPPSLTHTHDAGATRRRLACTLQARARTHSSPSHDAAVLHARRTPTRRTPTRRTPIARTQRLTHRRLACTLQARRRTPRAHGRNPHTPPPTTLPPRTHAARRRTPRAHGRNPRTPPPTTLPPRTHAARPSRAPSASHAAASPAPSARRARTKPAHLPQARLGAPPHAAAHARHTPHKHAAAASPQMSDSGPTARTHVRRACCPRSPAPAPCPARNIVNASGSTQRPTPSTSASHCANSAASLNRRLPSSSDVCILRGAAFKFTTNLGTLKPKRSTFAPPPPRPMTIYASGARSLRRCARERKCGALSVFIKHHVLQASSPSLVLGLSGRKLLRRSHCL
ncbi:hypothetical protein C8F04DRAFT_1248655 [Mycena alexandri]|uniref:Uncharacterized protein n=1 Tax=Mycena alexandri TaxID=1745969 RepID=A0AAD6TGY9_9AGAR|nr:hypothetical protein C8F04DRAFT_1248655 [Mycena alexandri]